ncbi:hypothetical protein [Coralliovum pocilloporae]|uniref:hypothetical protein n=1 Tax=Coralliovum pocilloporae TaxID=3066369 RepID=UPI0033076CE5
MKRVTFFVISASFIFAGCASVPRPKAWNITTTDVIKNIRCELMNAAWRKHPENKALLNGWGVDVDLTLKVFQKSGLSADAAFVVPLNPGTFTIGLSAGTTGDATRSERIQFSERINDLNREIAPLACDHSSDSKGKRALLSDLRIADFLGGALDSKNKAKIDISTLTYTVNFALTVDAGANPQLSAIPLGNSRTFGGNLNWSATQTDTHTLALNFAKLPKASCEVKEVDGKCPLPVYLVKDDRTRTVQRQLKGGNFLSDGTTPTFTEEVSEPKNTIKRNPEQRTAGQLTDEEKRVLQDAATRSTLRSIENELINDLNPQ